MSDWEDFGIVNWDEYDPLQAQYDSYIDLRQNIYDQYPDHAEKARNLINGYLRRYDQHRYNIFNCLIEDKDNEYYQLNSAHLLISDMLHYRDNGGTATDLQIDVFARKYLDLPPPVIEGNKSDL